MTFKFIAAPVSGLGGLVAFASVVALSGCAVAAAEPDVRDARWAEARWPGTTVEDLRGGRALFLSRCSSCHGLPAPSVKTPNQWASVMGEMAPRARLSDVDRDRLLRYLSATSARQRPDG